ncbi:MAG: bifunctional 3-deoxy-7-phosphoheptulonate synthase/chorismate mutase type II [Flavobacteriaceae bacterium]|jgi:chorismate mutase|nr:bifunctional 3-deoxy-7-phosphoheptulonate synthase/chorismate mutase type II [Flavobacteriaceae bacterium]MBT6705432.1 bifunctional 3-deoxy-7-phosphoheptulonate synthase/chorismate mutase type II [Flavobacteriaceae bacterium]
MKNNKNLKTWLNAMDLNHPLVIAGPCSAESEEQVLKIAHQLKNTDATILRAGIWKPRTRPGNFEGVGEIGLKWLKRAKDETGLLTATEVANPAHVELALKNDVDLLWIGARTTVSPFIVQEIAEALKGTDKIVLVKNPVNPDLALWLGAVERLHTSNINKLGVIHRGFSTYEKTRYRNNPEWQIPIDLQNQFPDLPLILDPSHIAGRRDIIFDLCQSALDLNFDGLMIETHHDPDNAWSDAKQQITPKTLDQLTIDLKIRKEEGDALEYLNKLSNLRIQIDVVDHKLTEILGKRMKIADEIGGLKKKNNVAILQNKRWNEILSKMILEGKEFDLSEEFVLKIYKAIHQESINHQKRLYDK